MGLARTLELGVTRNASRKFLGVARNGALWRAAAPHGVTVRHVLDEAQNHGLKHYGIVAVFLLIVAVFLVEELRAAMNIGRKWSAWSA